MDGFFFRDAEHKFSEPLRFKNKRRRFQSKRFRKICPAGIVDQCTEPAFFRKIGKSRFRRHLFQQHFLMRDLAHIADSRHDKLHFHFRKIRHRRQHTAHGLCRNSRLTDICPDTAQRAFSSRQDKGNGQFPQCREHVFQIFQDLLIFKGKEADPVCSVFPGKSDLSRIFRTGKDLCLPEFIRQFEKFCPFRRWSQFPDLFIRDAQQRSFRIHIFRLQLFQHRVKHIFRVHLRFPFCLSSSIVSRFGEPGNISKTALFSSSNPFACHKRNSFAI